MSWLEVWHVLEILVATGRTMPLDKFLASERDDAGFGVI